MTDGGIVDLALVSPRLPATMIALIAVLSLVPVFGVLFVRNENIFAVKFRSADAGGLRRGADHDCDSLSGRTDGRRSGCNSRS